MKDRIRLLMESQHMNQQSFASYIGLSPATLSSILQERTRPTLQTVELVCKKFPSVNLTWLINGTGEMFKNEHEDQSNASSPSEESSYVSSPAPQNSQPTLDFGYDEPAASSRPTRQMPQQRQQTLGRQQSVANVVEMKNIDKPSRKITEIRVFYDDQTWESFVPKK